ncbi:protein kinase domain-containing protein [Pirellulaceae bacterium SH501]
MEQIGEGGMGIVFVAEQTEPISRKVALKVIKPGMDSKTVIARFEAERQALAMMDHPNIARVLDAGTTSERLPYFVMELVRGVPITQYCDQAKASIEERLRLFQDVCAAVQHAHQKGIIHRDLKPSNILVTLHDGKPVVKVIDFGVAKALHQSLTDHTVYTAFNQVLGTPLYMSPEQLEMSGLDIDTRSDIYSLGVLLYELIAGTPPFDRDRLLKSGLDEMRRIVREEDPPRPSHRITTLIQSEISTAAERRGVTNKAFIRSLDSEIDWIILKAMEKDRNRRYDSASAFSADITRFLTHEIVTACPPSWWYLLQKSVRKNRIVLTTTTLITLSLIIGLAATIWQWQRAIVAERNTALATDLATSRANLANQRLEIAERTIEVMYTELAQEWLETEPGTTSRKMEFLTKAIDAFKHLSDETGAESALRPSSIRARIWAGQLMIKLGDYDEALKTFLIASEATKHLLTKEPKSKNAIIVNIQLQIALANFYRGRTNSDMKVNHTDLAVEAINILLSDAILDSNERSTIAGYLSDCSTMYSNERSRIDAARETADLAVDLARLLMKENPGSISSLKLLAHSLSVKGQQALWWGKENEACEDALAESVQLKRTILEREPDRLEVLRSLATTIQNYSVVLLRLGKKELHDSLVFERLQLLRDLRTRYPELPEIASQLGVALRLAGNGEYEKGNYQEAWKIWDECESIYEAILKKHPDIRATRRSLVLLLGQNANHKKLEGDIEAARTTLQKCVGYLDDFIRKYPDDFEMITLHNHIARDMAIVHLSLNEHDLALSAAKSIVAINGKDFLRSRTQSTRVRDYRETFGRALACNIGFLIANYCQDADNDSQNAPLVRESAIEFQKHCRYRLREILSEWRDRNLSLELEWRELADRIDSKDAWKAHHRPPSVDHLFEDALLSTRVDALDDFLQSILMVSPLPDFWSDTALVAVSAPEFKVTWGKVERLLERHRDTDNNSSNASRVEAWLKYRQEDYQTCLEKLTALGNVPEDGFVRALALKKLGNVAEASKIFNDTLRLLVEKEAEFSSRRKAEPLHKHPNMETLLRLKAEAEIEFGSTPLK